MNSTGDRSFLLLVSEGMCISTSFGGYILSHVNESETKRIHLKNSLRTFYIITVYSTVYSARLNKTTVGINIIIRV